MISSTMIANSTVSRTQNIKAALAQPAVHAITAPTSTATPSRRAAPALSRCRGTAGRGRAPARPHGGEGAIAPGKYLQVSMTAFYLVATDHVWVELEPERDAVDECATLTAGHGDGGHLSGPGMARHRREHQPGCGSGVCAPAGAEHQRKLGQGRPAHPDARSSQHERQEPAALARRNERRG